MPCFCGDPETNSIIAINYNRRKGKDIFSHVHFPAVLCGFLKKYGLDGLDYNEMGIDRIHLEAWWLDHRIEDWLLKNSWIPGGEKYEVALYDFKEGRDDETYIKLSKQFHGEMPFLDKYVKEMK